MTSAASTHCLLGSAPATSFLPPSVAGTYETPVRLSLAAWPNHDGSDGQTGGRASLPPLYFIEPVSPVEKALRRITAAIRNYDTALRLYEAARAAHRPSKRLKASLVRAGAELMVVEGGLEKRPST